MPADPTSNINTGSSNSDKKKKNRIIAACTAAGVVVIAIGIAIACKKEEEEEEKHPLRDAAKKLVASTSILNTSAERKRNGMEVVTFASSQAM